MVEQVFECLPFIKHASNINGDYKLSTSRIIEAIIIAAISGALSIYATQRVIETKLDAMSRQVERIENTVEKIRTDMYQPRKAG